MSKRILSVDTLRGYSIFYVLLLHALVMRVFEQDRRHIQDLWDKMPLFLIFVFIPFIIIMLWGAVFTFLSGISVTYSLTHQYLEDRSQLTTKFRMQFVRGILIILVQNLFLLLFSNQISGNTSISTNSLITGSLETLDWRAPSVFHFFTAGTLEAIVFSNWIICLILYVVWSKKQISVRKTYLYFIAIGMIIFVMTHVIFYFIGDQQTIIKNLGDQGRYVEQFLFIKIIGGRYSFFPTVAYGLFGAVIGMALANQETYKSISKYIFSFGAFFFSIFIFSIFNGFDYIKDFAGEHLPFNVYCFNLGGQMLLYGLLLKMDFVSPKQLKVNAKRTKFFRRYGKATLTLYCFEGLFSISLYRIFYAINNGSFYDNLLLLLVYEAMIFLFWYVLLRFMEKRKYKYTISNIIRIVEKKLIKQPPNSKKIGPSSSYSPNADRISHI